MKYLNVLSNAFYAIAGWVHSLEMGIPFTILAVASAGYHYFGTYFWQKADEVGMYIAFMAMIWLGIGLGLWQGLFVGVATICMSIYHKHFGSELIGVLAVLAIAANSAWLAIPFYLLAMGFKYMEWNNIGNYHAIHSVWHTISAIAMYITIL